MTEGPWYACLKVPTVHHTMGGVRIDTLARALDKDGKPVPGLYAAGEVTGGIHGANRLGGMLLLTSLLLEDKPGPQPLNKNNQ